MYLPEVEKYLPTEEGEPPLGRADVWAWDTTQSLVVSNELINHTTIHPLELNTMPGWAGSSWYFFRYMEDAADRNGVFASEDALKYWENVDLYIGGSEHATGHLLYSRFWVKFLKDRGFVNVEEPFKKLINQGMILGTSAFIYREENSNKYYSKGLIEGKNVIPLHVKVQYVNASDELDIEGLKSDSEFGEDYANAEFILENGIYKVGREVEKMSKSKYNVVNPDSICEDYGADSLRLYEMFLGPLEQYKPWNTAGITGVHGFLKKLWKLFHQGENGTFQVDSSPLGKSMGLLKPSTKPLRKLKKTLRISLSTRLFLLL